MKACATEMWQGESNLGAQPVPLGCGEEKVAREKDRGKGEKSLPEEG